MVNDKLTKSAKIGYRDGRPPLSTYYDEWHQQQPEVGHASSLFCLHVSTLQYANEDAATITMDDLGLRIADAGIEHEMCAAMI